MVSSIYKILFIIFFIPGVIFAHCQIPCGIYDDEMRFEMLYEHSKTIKKSVESILEKNITYTNNNQLTRWILNKENHANEIQEIMLNYFLAQRIKIPKHEHHDHSDKYHALLEYAHKIIFFAMRSKQTSDLKIVMSLKRAISDFEDVYNSKK